MPDGDGRAGARNRPGFEGWARGVKAWYPPGVTDVRQAALLFLRKLWTARVRRTTAIGLVSVLLLYLCFGLMHAFMLRIYKPGDERRHTEYVVVLESKGRLPTMRETRAANHPPLYYALVAKTVMRGVESTNGISNEVRMARVLSVGFGAIALVYAFLIVRLLLPLHPALAVHATAIIAVLPTYANTCAVLGNDSMSLAAQFAMIHAALLVLLEGPTWPRCLGLGLTLTIVALTRVSGAMVIPVALLAVLAGAWWHLGGSPRRRAVLGLLMAGGLLVSVTLSAAWFYARNLSDSGDPTGQMAILEQVRYQPVRSPWTVLFDSGKWMEIHDELWGRLAGMVNIGGALRELARMLTDVSVIGLSIAVWRARGWRWLRSWRTPRFFSWVIMAGVLATVFLPVFVYHARGGGLHPRYVFGALYVCTLLMAAGFAWSKESLVPIMGFGLTFVLCLALHLTYAALIAKEVETYPFEQVLANGIQNTVAAATWLTVGLGLGVSGVVYALGQLHRPLHGQALAERPCPPDGVSNAQPQSPV